MLQHFPPFPADRSDPSSCHKIPPTHTSQGGQMSPTAPELLCWGFHPHPGVVYDPLGWQGAHSISKAPEQCLSLLNSRSALSCLNLLTFWGSGKLCPIGNAGRGCSKGSQTSNSSPAHLSPFSKKFKNHPMSQAVQTLAEDPPRGSGLCNTVG